MSKETIKIESPNLIDFVDDIQEKVREGYTVDKTNAGIPQSFGFGLYTCTLSKGSESAPKQEPKQEPKEPEPKVEEPASESAEEPQETSKEEPKEEPKKTTRRRKSSK